jgi:hypothetical protein
MIKNKYILKNKKDTNDYSVVLEADEEDEAIDEASSSLFISCSLISLRICFCGSGFLGDGMSAAA